MSSSEQLHDPLTGQHLTLRPTGRDTGGSLLEAEVRLDPGGRVPRHAHLRQDERVTVTSGSILVRVGRIERTLGPGDAIDVPRRRAHVVRNTGAGEARFVLEVRPARHMHLALRALFALSSALAPLAGKHRRSLQPSLGGSAHTGHRRSGEGKGT